MWYLRVFLPVFLVVGVVLAEFTDIAKNNEICENVEPASDFTILSTLEKALQFGKGIKEKWFALEFKDNPSPSLKDVLNKAKKFKLIPPGR